MPTIGPYTHTHTHIPHTHTHNVRRNHRSPHIVQSETKDTDVVQKTKKSSKNMPTIGPYSPFTISKLNGLIFVSGQISHKKLTFNEQAHEALERLEKVLEDANASFVDVAFVQIYLHKIQVRKKFIFLSNHHKMSHLTSQIALLVFTRRKSSDENDTNPHRITRRSTRSIRNF